MRYRDELLHQHPMEDQNGDPESLINLDPP